MSSIQTPNQNKKTPLNGKYERQKSIGNKYSTFELCTMINKLCGFCVKDNYNPITGKKDSKEKLFCGLAPPSWDTRVSSLDKCPKRMSAYEKSKHSKSKRDEYKLIT